MYIIWGLDQQLQILGHLVEVSVILLISLKHQASHSQASELKDKRKEKKRSNSVIGWWENSHRAVCFYQGEGKLSAGSLPMRPPLMPHWPGAGPMACKLQGRQGKWVCSVFFLTFLRERWAGKKEVGYGCWCWPCFPYLKSFTFFGFLTT